MRAEADREKVERVIRALGKRAKGEGNLYLAGGATAIWYGWRETTIDLDICLDPEPQGIFEAIAEIKEEHDVNVELASPGDFIPLPSGWRERSIFVLRAGQVDVFHFDPYSQALSKVERGHARDLADVRSMIAEGLVFPEKLKGYFEEIEGGLIRYPSIDPGSFAAAIDAILDPDDG